MSGVIPARQNEIVRLEAYTAQLTKETKGKIVSEEFTATGQIANQNRIAFVATATALTAMAAGMGWGIRGQYGHESGAMIAGTLTSLALVLMFVPQAPSLAAARAAAMMTVAIGIGGTMTYGQTVGLTHDHNMIGNWEALSWGMLGLLIKGGIWIGFAGVFLGMGLGGKRYRPLEMLLLMLALIGLLYLGLWLINSPFDLANRRLPRIYFSGSWYFHPDKLDLKPRREVWGGLLIALVGLVCYVGAIRRDTLAARMAIVGFIAGGIGFPGGQSLQAFHSWNPELFNTGALSHYKVFSYFNWWNMMETTFGMIFGAVLAFGLWLNRKHIDVQRTENEISLTPTVEATLIVVHLALLLTSEFLRLPGNAAIVSRYTDMGFFMCVLPLIGIVGGRFWPYLHLLPVVAAPICGKQLRNLVYDTSPAYSVEVGWVLFAMIPIGVSIVTAVYLISASLAGQKARAFSATALLVTTWLYFGLNTYFFHFAWPWQEWSGRTPNQIIFAFCTLCLTVAAMANLLKGYRLNQRLA